METSKRCSTCKCIKSTEDFYLDSRNGNPGYQCKSCQKARLRDRYKSESQEQRERRRVYNREYMRKKSILLNKDPEKKQARSAKSKECRAKNQTKCLAVLREFKGRGCCVCGEMEYCCIDAHHVDPSKKEYAIGSLVLSGMKLKRFINELEKCIPLCANCHRKFHAGISEFVERVERFTLAAKVDDSADGELNSKAA